jgi:hypothetical protein
MEHRAWSIEQEEIIANFELRIANLRKHKADWRKAKLMRITNHND